MTASLTNSSDIDNACSVIQEANRNQRHICNIPRSKGALNQGQQRLAHSRNTEKILKITEKSTEILNNAENPSEL